MIDMMTSKKILDMTRAEAQKALAWMQVQYEATYGLGALHQTKVSRMIAVERRDAALDISVEVQAALKPVPATTPIPPDMKRKFRRTP